MLAATTMKIIVICAKYTAALLDDFFPTAVYSGEVPIGSSCGNIVFVLKMSLHSPLSVMWWGPLDTWIYIYMQPSAIKKGVNRGMEPFLD